jgi:chorismate mutase/prephenate dehydratase
MEEATMEQGANEGGLRELDEYRKDINLVDEQILSLLSRRQALASEIGRIKRDAGVGVPDPAQEQEVMRRLISKPRDHLKPETVRSIFSEIISAERSVQQAPTVAYLGPEATFSHQAALFLFGKLSSLRAAGTIEEVFGMVEKGVCDQGVVPIENSYEGSVNITLDLFYKYNLTISAELFLRIRNNLLSKEERIEDIKRLYSHPMPVAQCRQWLNSHLSWVPIMEVASTSLAAKMAADESGAAAIGSRLSGPIYGLNILEENIEDHPDNITRFFVIGKTRAKPTGKDKVSLLFFLQHVPGALHKALEALAKRDVNMTRIESRPMRTRNWEYLFYLDLEGHEEDGNMHSALEEMEEHCIFIKRLGSYPAGGDPWD